MVREIGVQFQKAMTYLAVSTLISWIVSLVARHYHVTDDFEVKADTFWKALSEEGDTRVFLVAALVPVISWALYFIMAAGTIRRLPVVSKWAWRWSRRMMEDILAIAYNAMGFFFGAFVFFDNNRIGLAAKANAIAITGRGIFLFTCGLAVVGGIWLHALHHERPA